METPELNFIVDDLLLDFPGDDTVDGGLEAAPATGTSTDNSFNSTAEQSHFTPATDVGGPCNFTADVQFSGELTVPEDDLAELEWVSKFVEESFSSEDLQKLQLIQGIKAQTTEPPQYQFQPQTGPAFQPEVSVPAKARSKRSRTAPDNWTSRLLAVSPTPAANAPAGPLSSENDKKTSKPKKREGPENLVNGEGRRCLHCATNNTPQWRTGPMGPKTLCNACGVRYKSGRLVPEYRPAASPTFVLSKHSNSHRKVLELRRQKEMQQQQQFLHHHHHHHQNMMFDMSNGDEYLIHQHIGPGPIFGS